MGKMLYVSVSEPQHELTCKFKFLAAWEISCTEILFSEKFLPHHSSCKFFLSTTVESPIWASWKKKDCMIDGWLVGRFRFRATLSIGFFLPPLPLLTLLTVLCWYYGITGFSEILVRLSFSAFYNKTNKIIR